MREGSGQTTGEGLELEGHRGESLSLCSVPLPRPVFTLFLFWACRQGSPQLPPHVPGVRSLQDFWAGRGRVGGYGDGAKFPEAEKLGDSQRGAGGCREPEFFGQSPLLQRGAQPRLSAHR